MKFIRAFRNPSAIFFFSAVLLISSSYAGVSRDLSLPENTSDADEIAKQVYFANHFYAFKNFSFQRRGNIMTLLITRTANGKQSTTALERHLNNNYAEDDAIRSRDLTIFHSGKLRDTGMLITDFKDDEKNQSYMLWVPSSLKIRRFDQPKHEINWGGSVFTFGDVTLRKPEHETHELIGKKRLRTCLGSIEELENKQYRFAGKLPERSCRHLNKEVYGLKSTSKFQDWWYDYRISYVDTKSYADYRTLYYKGGELIKVIDRDWGMVKGLDGDPRALFCKYWYGLEVKTGRETWAVIPHKVVAYNSNRDNSYWTEETLEKIKH